MPGSFWVFTGRKNAIIHIDKQYYTTYNISINQYYTTYNIASVKVNRVYLLHE